MFGKRLKTLREKKDMLQKDLAEILDVSSGAIGMYENGKRTPDYEILKKIADYFEVSVDYLLGRTDIKTSTNIETKAYHNLDVGGLSEEAIQQIEDYIEFVKQKYNPDGTLKKK